MLDLTACGWTWRRFRPSRLTTGLDVDQPARARDRRMIRRASGGTKPRNSRSANESAARQAIARTASRPSKYPINSSRNSTLAEALVGRTLRRRIADTRSRRRNRSRPCRESDSIACKNGCAALRGGSWVAIHNDRCFACCCRLPLAIVDSVVRRDRPCRSQNSAVHAFKSKRVQKIRRAHKSLTET